MLAPVAGPRPTARRADSAFQTASAGRESRVTAHSGRVGLASELTSRGASTTDVRTPLLVSRRGPAAADPDVLRRLEVGEASAGRGGRRRDPGESHGRTPPSRERPLRASVRAARHKG